MGTTTKTIKNIQQKMQAMDESSIRCQALSRAKDFKTSWIALGQTLYSVWKDKLYKDWGYTDFDAYTSKEIGIRKQTAMKLLRSYYFLEKEGPYYLAPDYAQKADVAFVPTCESVDLLRRASKRKELDRADYTNFKKKILEFGRDTSEAKRDLTALLKEKQELEPQEAWEKKRVAFIRRLLGTLKTLRTELKTTKILPEQILKETERLIDRLESTFLSN
jgi:hypothetical protein